MATNDGGVCFATSLRARPVAPLSVIHFLRAATLGLLVMSGSVSAKPAVDTRVDNVVESFHGQAIADPYRWLEAGDTPEVAAWTRAQNALTRTTLDRIPGREALAERFWSLSEIGSLGTPTPRPLRTGRKTTWRYFYTQRRGKQNQPVLFVRDGLSGADRALVDVNALATDGTRSLDWWFPSEDGRLVAYGVSADGNEESVLHVRNVDSGVDHADVIPRTRACSVAWLPDGTGFYYTRYPEAGAVPAGEEAYHRHVFFHRLGGDPKNDAPVFGQGRDRKDWPGVTLSPNGRWLIVEVSEGWSKSEVYALPVAVGVPETPGPAIEIATGADAVFDVAELTNREIYLRTNSGAARYQLTRVSLPRAPAARTILHSKTPLAVARSTWRTILPESKSTLQQVARVGRVLAALYLEDAVSRVRLYDLDGRAMGEVSLPGLGTVAGLGGHSDGSELFVPFASFLSPTTILRQGLSARDRVPPTSSATSATGSRASVPEVWRALEARGNWQAFEVTQSRFRSKDGTEIPLFLVGRKDVARDGARPTLLYGYGGFNVDITPSWSPAIVPFLERGGLYAVAVLRGGGEYGESWHQAGMLSHKQNVFDDFIGAAEHLIAEKRTDARHLGIMGRSNGGLLVGAALTQRPDLFRAVICGVPLLDMLRYHRFRIAQLWIPEYGSAENAEDFAWLRAYSPYHHVTNGVAYPAVLFTTAESDTRVDPLHARKMTARLQAATSSGRPVLLRLEAQAGHGAGKPLAKVIAQQVDEWSFLFDQWQIDSQPTK